MQPIEIQKDTVDQLLQQWAKERPKMNVSALGVVVRIQMLAKLLQQRTARALRQHDLKHWEYDVLSALRRQGEPFEMSASDIAHTALLTSGAMTTRIDGLEERGLVKRRRSSSDGRSVLVRLTPQGMDLVDGAIEARLDEANDTLADISLEERQRMAASLRDLLISIESSD
jgi:DNA-binding MarR family transcriptional regulator